MAGSMKHVKGTQPDILFDLTPEDDEKLRESDLIQLVNYGQLSKEIELLGTDGKVYKVELALLWDEDYVDILKKTQEYSNDSILRVKILRRLKLFKSIQFIDGHNYADTDDARAQRELWSILCRMSDAQIEQLDNKYHEIELERDLAVVDGMRMLGEKMNETAPSKEEEPSGNKSQVSESEQHMALFEEHKQQTENAEKAVKGVVQEVVEGDPVSSGDNEETDKPVASSPKQDEVVHEAEPSK